MLGSFRVRMLIVIILVAMVGLSIQSGHSSKKIVEPLIRYVLKDQGWDEKIALVLGNVMGDINKSLVPVESRSTLRIPCDFIGIEKNYGWFWDAATNKQQFFPGITLQVEEDTLINPVLEGVIEEVSWAEDGSRITIKHSEELYSYYGNLQEVLVEEGDIVSSDTIIGKSASYFYFELRDKSGPVNPSSLFE